VLHLLLHVALAALHLLCHACCIVLATSHFLVMLAACCLTAHLLHMPACCFPGVLLGFLPCFPLAALPLSCWPHPCYFATCCLAFAASLPGCCPVAALLPSCCLTSILMQFPSLHHLSALAASLTSCGDCFLAAALPFS
jgi:hypothetical protein